MVGSVPSATLGRLRARLRDIGHTLSTVSSSSAFWSSMSDSPLYVDVEGWRFKYTIDRQLQVLAVIDVSRQAAEDLGFTKSGKAKVKLEVEK